MGSIQKHCCFCRIKLKTPKNTFKLGLEKITLITQNRGNPYAFVIDPHPPRVLRNLQTFPKKSQKYRNIVYGYLFINSSMNFPKISPSPPLTF